jgi:hypothetical protein
MDAFTKPFLDLVGSDVSLDAKTKILIGGQCRPVNIARVSCFILT